MKRRQRLEASEVPWLGVKRHNNRVKLGNRLQYRSRLPRKREGKNPDCRCANVRALDFPSGYPYQVTQSCTKLNAQMQVEPPCALPNL